MKNQIKEVYSEIILSLGARSQFQLQDGTSGSLNKANQLKYPVRFCGYTGEEELICKAYIDINTGNHRPYILNTMERGVKVLGTRPNIYSYPKGGYQEITLES
ncbi:MAG: hypothetical protein R3218_09970 [Christiangramia sp.]|nr:hypothetical protein [Christiangramia sp.]